MNRLRKIALELTPYQKNTITRIVRELSEYTDDATRIVTQKKPEEKEEKKAGDEVGRILKSLAPILDDSVALVARTKKKDEKKENKLRRKVNG